MEFVSRVVGGWNVRMTLGGKRQGKFFADAKHGGKRAALEAARQYRDLLAARRQSRIKPNKPRPLLVVRGNASYCQIRIPKAGGRSTTTEFSISRHGPREAKRLAVAAYRAATSEVKLG